MNYIYIYIHVWLDFLFFFLLRKISNNNRRMFNYSRLVFNGSQIPRERESCAVPLFNKE